MHQLMAAMENSPQAFVHRRLSEQIHSSPRMIAQRQQFAKINGEVFQRVGSEAERVQDQFKPIQRVEGEELLQGKIDVAQRIEDEKTVQGKFKPVQRIEDGELLLEKFSTAQFLAPKNKPDNTDKSTVNIVSTTGIVQMSIAICFSS